MNARIAPDGWLKAELRNTARKPIAHYRLDQCDPMTGNVMSAQMIRHKRNKIEPSVNESRRVMFKLKSAKLYSSLEFGHSWEKCAGSRCIFETSVASPDCSLARR